MISQIKRAAPEQHYRLFLQIDMLDAKNDTNVRFILKESITTFFSATEFQAFENYVMQDYPELA